MRERKTRGDLLAFAISFALTRATKVVRGLRLGLTNEERFLVADDAVNEMKRYGDPWQLNEALPPGTAAGPPNSQMQDNWTDRKKQGE